MDTFFHILIYHGAVSDGWLAGGVVVTFVSLYYFVVNIIYFVEVALVPPRLGPDFDPGLSHMDYISTDGL